METKLSLQEKIVEASRGSHESYLEIVSLFEESVYHLSYYSLGSKERAEEILFQVFNVAPLEILENELDIEEFYLSRTAAALLALEDGPIDLVSGGSTEIILGKLQCLQMRQRIAFVLSCVLQRDSESISRILDVSMRGVEDLLFFAHRNFRDPRTAVANYIH